MLGLFLFLITPRANAFLYTFTPSDADMFDLDHFKYYSWGINWKTKPGEQITGAEIFIDNINNWQKEDNDKLYVNLLDYAKLGLKTFDDNQGGGNNFDNWSGKHILLDTYTDKYDLPGPSEDYSYWFDANEIKKLDNYSANDGRFGLGFDPDCHYFNDGVKLKIYTSVVPEPATVVMMMTGLVGSALRLRRKQTI